MFIISKLLFFIFYKIRSVILSRSVMNRCYDNSIVEYLLILLQTSEHSIALQPSAHIQYEQKSNYDL